MPTLATANNTPLFFDFHVNGAGAYDWTQNNHEISGYGDGYDSTVQQLYTHEIYAETYTHDNVTWTESWGNNNDLLAHFPQVNFVGDVGLITNTNGFQNFTADINGYTLNPTIDWDVGYDPSQINWDHADDNYVGSFNSGDWGTFTEMYTPDQANNTMTLSFSGSMTTVGGETLENVDIDVIIDSNENPVSMTGTATLNGNQVVFDSLTFDDNTPLFFDFHVNGAGAYDWTQNNHEISGYGDGYDSTVQQLYTHEIYAETYTHDNVTWTESWGNNNDLLAHFPQVNFVGDVGLITNTNGFQNFTADINGYTLNPTIDWDVGYDPSQINWDHADDNYVGSFNSGDWGTFTEMYTPDQANNTMTLSFSGSMTTVGGETLENVDIDVIIDSNENPVSMAGTATLNGNQVVFDHGIIADTFANSTVGITTDTNGDTTIIVTDTNGNSSTFTDVENFNFSDQNFDTAGLHANTEVRDLFYEMVLNDAGTAYDQVYAMPELFLFPGNPEMEALYDYSYVMPTDNTVGDIIVGSSGNDFINGMGGGDGIIAGDGNDVIDGGLGSNFLTGGNGDDVFYADGRGAHVAGWTREDDEVWTTVTDFNNGNSQATIWGYIDGTSTYTWEANQGAAGWEGITLRADLDGNGVVDTSFTFTGIDNQSELTLATNVVGDLGYILVS